MHINKGSVLGLAVVLTVAGLLPLWIAIYRAYNFAYSKAAFALAMAIVVWVVACNLYAIWFRLDRRDDEDR